MKRIAIFSLAVAWLLTVANVDAKHFRWASQGDATTMDPHANNEGLNNNINNHVYEYLAQRDQQYKLVPWLATSWENVSPTQWIVKLRRGVRFHDGTPFTADDVVFSFDRARVANSTFKLYATQAGTVRRIDEHTVEFTTPAPNPVFQEALADIMIMSKAWAEKNRVTRPQNYRENEDSFSARNAMGTGPYKLVSYQPGVKTLHEKNKDWWGIREGLFPGNVDTTEYRPISNAATRMAAIRSGDLDFVLDPSVQDIAMLRKDAALKVWEGNEVRIIYLGFDQSRDQLTFGDVKGRNPFKDIRVRKALYQAIDVQAIHSQVMRGLSRPTAINLPDPKGAGVRAELDKRFPYDPPASRRLLAEAGYPDGFGFTLHCPNDRYINDEKICVAVAAMWARVGLTVKAETLPRTQYFPRAAKREFSAFMHGWGGGSSDPIYTFKPILHSRDLATGLGDGNWGEFKVPRLDALIDAIDVEMDKAKRTALINDAIQIVRDEVLTIPLHHQVIPWVSKASVSVVHTPNNFMRPQWVSVR
jgi:peptide/nickel transport system substrate-binding protein